MASEKNTKEYKSLTSSKAKKSKSGEYSSLTSGKKKRNADDVTDETKSFSPNDGKQLNPAENNDLSRSIPNSSDKKDFEIKEDISELSFSERKKLDKENMKKLRPDHHVVLVQNLFSIVCRLSIQ